MDSGPGTAFVWPLQSLSALLHRWIQICRLFSSQTTCFQVLVSFLYQTLDVFSSLRFAPTPEIRNERLDEENLDLKVTFKNEELKMILPIL